MTFPVDLMAPLRKVIASNLDHAFTNNRFPQEQYHEPAGDVGLFGPDSVTWKVHGHPSAIVGGFSSLMLQMLHPLAMAGVAEHSGYQNDPLSRLSRTASFVAGTTYGSTEVAESMIRTVLRVHKHVHGIAPDGRPYSALDGDLVTWVHVAEMTSIVNSHRRYHPWPIRGTDIDRYFDENAIVAEKLGGTDIPRSRAQVRQYFRDIRGELTLGDQARETMAFITRPIGDDPISRGISLVLLQAAIDLMPRWAQKMHEINRLPGFDLVSIRPTVFALVNTLDLVGGTPIAVRESRKRVAATTVS